MGKKEQPFQFGTQGPERPPWPVALRQALRRLRGPLLLIALVAAAAYAVHLHDPGALRRWLSGTPLAPAPSVTQVYKWRDVSGGWHITDAPPAAGIAYERIEYRGDVNVLPIAPESGR
jgi:hypothetical protein